MPAINSTVRIRRTGAQGAPVKAGDCGTVVAVHEPTEETPLVLVTRVKGETWYFTQDDVEVLDSDGIFEQIATALTSEDPDPADPEAYDLMGQVLGIRWVYSNDGLDHSEPVPAELPFVPDGEDDDDEEEGDLVALNAAAAAPVVEEPVVFPGRRLESAVAPGHDDCPEGPHFHQEDGEVLPLPFLGLTDAEGDVAEIIDVTQIEGGPDLVMRLTYPRTGRRMEVHLSEHQALAIAAFLIRTFGPPTTGSNS